MLTSARDSATPVAPDNVLGTAAELRRFTLEPWATPTGPKEARTRRRRRLRWRADRVGQQPAGVRTAPRPAQPFSHGNVAASRTVARPLRAFDLLRRGVDLTRQPYTARRAALVQLFAEQSLGPRLALCPSTTYPATAAEWLTWSSVGMEGLVFKSLRQPYLGGRRGWRKYRSRASAEAVFPVKFLCSTLQDAAGESRTAQRRWCVCASQG